MNTSHRQSVVLTLPQLAVLRDEATIKGITVAELIRRVIDEWREGRPRPVERSSA